MKQTTHPLSRRKMLKGTAATGLAAASAPAWFRPAIAVPETVKIGLVGPRTGFLALFYEEMSWAIEHAKKSTDNSITINGTKHPLEIVVKDSQSNPNRASSVTQELILNDKVHIVTAFATPETVNPVSDQCEINGMPCVTNDDPLEFVFLRPQGRSEEGLRMDLQLLFQRRLGDRGQFEDLGARENQQETRRNVGQRRRRARLRARHAAGDQWRRFHHHRSGPLRSAGQRLHA